jgi:hypothetical protein
MYDEEMAVRARTILLAWLTALALGGCELAFPVETQSVAGPADHVDGGGGASGAGGSPCQSGFECEPAVPAGWEGYYRLSEVNNDASAPPPSPCPDGSQPVRMYANPAPAVCSQCQCGTLTGAQCAPRISCSTTSRSCSGATDWTAYFANGLCDKNGSPAQLSCEASSSTVTNPGSCAPSGGTYTNLSQLFDGLLDVCGSSLAGGGCSAGRVCVTRATGTYASPLCIRKAGDPSQTPGLSCPAGWGTKPFAVGYQGGVDQRGCTPCQCTPGGETCGAPTYTFYDYDDCTSCGIGCDGPITVNEACRDVSVLLDQGSWSAKLTAVPAASGSCTPSGGQPTGSVKGQGAVSFCCQAQ